MLNSIDENHATYTWWGRLDLNQRPISYEPTALTTELRPLMCYHAIVINRGKYNKLTGNITISLILSD